MNRRRRTAIRSKRLTILEGTVDYVNCRKVRVRLSNGDLTYPRVGYYPDVLPGDIVELARQSTRYSGQRKASLEIIGLIRSVPHQIVGLVVEYGRRKQKGLWIEPVGFTDIGLIKVPTHFKKPVIDEYYKVTITRYSDHWRLQSFDQQLNSSRDIAVAVALCRFGIQNSWNSDVEQELADIPDSLDSAEFDSRRDLTKLPFVTIDPATAKDHDDAIYCEERGNEGFRLFVAIADVAHYVKSESAIDIEAHARGTSVYLPATAVPMLPDKLSSSLCSLVENEERLAVVCQMEIGLDGTVGSYSFFKAVICAQANLSYSAIKRTHLSKTFGRSVTNNLDCLFEVSDLLLHARSLRGTLDLDIPAAKIKVNSHGEPVAIHQSKRLAAHRLVEEAMLAANVCAAEFMLEHYPQASMYRIHDPPKDDDLKELNGILEVNGHWMEYDNNPTVYDYQQVIQSMSKEQNLLAALQVHILRSLSTAIYSDESKPHFALNYDHYTHFTSPIRRYPDLVVHRLIKSVLDKSASRLSRTELKNSAEQCSYLERRADSCEREAKRWLVTDYMFDRIGEKFTGVIVDVKSFGLFVQVFEPYVDGLVPISDLGNEYFFYDERSRQLIGESTGKTYSIGKQVHVRLIQVYVELGHIDFKLIQSKSRKSRARRLV